MPWCPDLYRGKVTLEAAEAAHLMGELNFGDAASQDIRGALQQLKDGSPKVAVLGFCMGGSLSILAAVYAPEADAAVSWYGIPPSEAADVRSIRIPLQCHFGLKDAFFPPSQAAELEAKLKEGNVQHEIHYYEAGHAFGNETGESYDPEATELAWQRTVDFLNRSLA